MKKTLILILFLTLFISGASAQITKIGAATGYNYRYHFNKERYSDHLLTKFPPLSFVAIYEVNLPIHIVPRISIYFPNIYKEDLVDYLYKNTLWGLSVDMDVHYVFNSLDKLELYGLAGPNILFMHRKYMEEYGGQEIYTSTGNDSALGLNLGIGGYCKAKEEFDIFFEAKGIIASQIQVVVTVGILLNMDYLWKRETDSGY